MFVEINNTDMDVFLVEKWINETRDANGGVISPEFAMEILTKTNHFAHIKKVINHIKLKNKTVEEISPYKEFILSCVDGRKQEGLSLQTLQKIADDCGFREEFEEVNSKQPKVYGKDDCDAVVVNDIEDFKDNLKGKKRIIAIITSSISSFRCYNEDFNKVERLVVAQNNVIDFVNINNLPQKLNFASSDFVTVKQSDCSKVKEVIIKDDACVRFVDCKGFTGSYDFSQALEIDLADSDFSKAQYVKLGNTSFVSGTIMPEIVDMTCCGGLNDVDVDYSHTKTCILKKNSFYEERIIPVLKAKGIEIVYLGEKIMDNKKSDSGFLGHLFDRGND